MKISRRDYPDNNVDMKKLSTIVERFFVEEGFVVKMAFNNDKGVIQARKGGIFRTLLEMDRAFTIIFWRKNGNIEITMGIAKTMETLDSDKIHNINSGIFLKIPEALWAYEIEHHLWNNIEMYLDNE